MFNSNNFVKLKEYKKNLTLTMAEDRKVRVRFAPSPTGPLHIGGVRTALYNFLYAKKHGGDFILRIEDTDQTRYIEGAESYISEALNWCGITWDEGPLKGGPYAPYRQSDRKEIYHKHVAMLLDKGHAYYAFDTSEELEEMRKQIEREKSGNPQYDAVTRKKMRNSLTLSDEETKRLLESGKPYVVRALIPENEEVAVNDIIRGRLKVNTSTLDDKVLMKADGLPTYHLANVVDDYLMAISHVIRGEEWLPSAPLHVLLYRFFGWEDQMPEFAHLPLILKPDGKGKLSKRDGERLGFPVFPLKWKDPETGEVSSGYRESGYFPEAFGNTLALLGWNPGTEQEIFSEKELIQEFSLEKVSKAGANFNPDKAKWFNHQYLLRKSNEEVANQLHNIVRDKGHDIEPEKLTRIVALVKDRVNFVNELWDQISFFFEPPKSFDEKIVKKKWKEQTPSILEKLTGVFSATDPFTAENIDNALKSFMEKNDVGAGIIMIGLRICMVGEAKGPDIKEVMEILGREEVIERINYALRTIN